MTDMIQRWIESEENRTDNWAKFAYLNITRSVMKACFTNYKGNMPLSKNKFRDKIQESEAHSIARMELLAADIINNIDEVFPDKTAKERYKLLSEKLLQLGEVIGRMQSATIDELFGESDETNNGID